MIPKYEFFKTGGGGGLNKMWNVTFAKSIEKLVGVGRVDKRSSTD